MRFTHLILPAFFIFGLSTAMLAQQSTFRGSVLDRETGEPISFANVLVRDTDFGTNTDLDGFFTVANIPVGTYEVVVTYLGYDSTVVTVTVAEDEIPFKRIFMEPSAVELAEVEVSGRRERARTETTVSTLQVTSKQIRSLPSIGGEADIAQYLPVLPGIIVSGDQGGQLYIRGGSPVQNRIMIDGMTIYNPFHSIGFFSVFETETIRSVDVLTGGFNAEHGGRISAIVDIKTRQGNKKRFSGLVSASPFQAKALLEGPIKKLNEENGSSISFMLTGKHSYLDQSSKVFYPYAQDTAFFSFAAGDTSLAEVDDVLPYRYTDLYGKLSFNAGNGSQLNLFGFNFNDRFNFVGVADSEWNTFGLGANFTLVPPSSNIIIDGTVAFSDYQVDLTEGDGRTRSSAITDYSVLLNFSYYGRKNEVNYGFAFTGFNTDFTFPNALGININQQDFTTELAAFIKYKQIVGDFILEPGFRLQYFASQSEIRPEPRLSVKWNATDELRFKAGAGLYSQNLISTTNDLDVVNFFNGFLAGPEQTLFEPNSTTPTGDNLQKSWHAIAGIEYDLSRSLTLNVEPYYKRFTQLITINRNRLSTDEPEFVTETGDAYGIDFSARYERENLYLWATYSLGYVKRDDGIQEYFTVFDRRHNVNFLASYAFGKNNSWEAGLRWNLGSGFPFTQTQGFYQGLATEDLLLTNVLTGNFNLETLLSGNLNEGRLPYYHRLDASLKKTFAFGKYTRLEITAAVTNMYDRENVFFVDRITNRRVNQLPILPSLSATFKF